MRDRVKVAYIALAATVTWLALGIQFYFFIQWAIRRDMGALYGIWNYFSYFTHLSNLLAGLMLLFALNHRNDQELLLRKASTLTGAAVFLIMTCIIFNLELRHQSNSTGLSHIADIVLHDATPLLFLGFWWFCIPHSRLRIKDALGWLPFPVLYFCYVLIRGNLIGHYPYPFLNVAKYGYASVIGNGLEMLAGFLSMGLCFVAADRFKLSVAPGEKQ